MKKLVSLIVLTIIMSGNLFSQDCLNDVYYTLVNQKNPGKAKNQFDKKCFPGNEGNANIWLMKGNVYIMFYFNEMEEEQKNKTYKMKNPDLIIEAYEAFKKALELNPNVEPMSRMFSPIQGQEKCAGPIYSLGDRYRVEKNYDKALDCYLKAQAAYRISLPNTVKPNENINVFYTNINIYTIYRIKEDFENYRNYLRRAYQFKDLKIDYVYEDIYALFLNEKDTHKLEFVIDRAYSNIPDTLNKRFNIQLLELNYRYITNQRDTLKNLALNLINSIGIDSTRVLDLTEIMQYLVNINVEDELQSFLNQKSILKIS
jgi:tetratricopeptide (TPR) repeat protein